MNLRIKNLIKKIPGIKTANFFFKYRLVSIDNFLIGQQSGYPLEEWIEKTGDYGRISIALADSPYVKLLEEMDKLWPLVPSGRVISETEYFKMAEIAINHTGHFFEAKNREEIFEIIIKFYNLYIDIKQKKKTKMAEKNGHSSGNSPILAKKIKNSRYYEIIDGHHRLAIYYMLGKKAVFAKIAGKKNTYLQNLVLSSRQTNGRYELYQPIKRPEIETWPVVRLCYDRWILMQDFLKEKKIKANLMLDLSCSYGYFLKKFKASGCGVLGVDIDRSSLKICREINQLNPEELKNMDVISFLDFSVKQKKFYDIVLFLSIFHHFLIGKNPGDPDEIIKHIDKITNKIMFFETGQNHEDWNKKKLSRWDEEYIIWYLKAKTSFREFKLLGRDKDNRGIYKNQYQRALIACSK